MFTKVKSGFVSTFTVSSPTVGCRGENPASLGRQWDNSSLRKLNNIEALRGLTINTGELLLLYWGMLSDLFSMLTQGFSIGTLSSVISFNPSCLIEFLRVLRQTER